MKTIKIIYLLISIIASIGLHAQGLSFSQSKISAGKASLTNDAYYTNYTIAKANFSPELQYPIQLSYDSSNKSAGILGFGWSAPQLESFISFNGKATVWYTPWGEKVELKSAKDLSADTLELFGETANGNAYYSALGDWSAKGSSKSGNWKIFGRGNLEGWQFVYSKSLLSEIIAPTNEKLKFAYKDGCISSIKQNSSTFVSIKSDNGLLKELEVNGVSYFFDYKRNNIELASKTAKGKAKKVEENFLTSVEQTDVSPLKFDYDNFGYLNEIAQDDFIDKLKIDTKTSRILSDNNFKYTYGESVGDVSLTNKLDQTASFVYDTKKGTFTQRNFSGRELTIHYFMRYDVGYNGRIRKIVNKKGETLVSYQYDDKSGNITRITDQYLNDINFEYDKNDNVIEVSKCAYEEVEATPIKSFEYEKGMRKPSKINALDADGKVVQTTSIKYNTQLRPIDVDNGERNMSVSYNSYGYPIKGTDAFGLSNKVEYNKYNRVDSTENPFGVKNKVSYDSTGRRNKIETTFENEVLDTVSISYGQYGMPSSVMFADGTSKNFVRDEYGRVIKEIFADSSSVSYKYDTIGNLAQVTDERGNDIFFKWNEFGLESRQTAVGQITENKYNAEGKLEKTTSRFEDDVITDREIKYIYDQFDRIVEVNYGNGEIETRSYDNWGRLVEVVKGNVVSSYEYDKRGRLVGMTDGNTVNAYKYDNYGRRTSRITKVDMIKTLEETSEFDKFGRLVKTSSGDNAVEYKYNNKNQLIGQRIGSNVVRFDYTKLGQLSQKTLLDDKGKVLSLIKYHYAKNGDIKGRTANGRYEKYEYDLRKQLIRVVDGNSGLILEKYTYDETGNILEKTINGETTSYTYDESNQLVSSTHDGITVNYKYDAAGRMINEGTKTYTYGWLDKVMNVSDSNGVLSEYTYFNSGQLANATHNPVAGDSNNAMTTETFVWDGLALIDRNGTSYINEPHAGGGNPVLAINSSNGTQAIFNDMLGTSLGTVNAGEYSSITKTTFGYQKTNNTATAETNFYTGKPNVRNLGYVFLMRNYRSDLSKWQTEDPLGYPDGWNNFAYCNNRSTMGIDLYGTEIDIRLDLSYCSELEYVYTDTEIYKEDANLIVYQDNYEIYIQQKWDTFDILPASEILTYIESGGYKVSAISGMASAYLLTKPNGQILGMVSLAVSGVSFVGAFLAELSNEDVEILLKSDYKRVFSHNTFKLRFINKE